MQRNCPYKTAPTDGPGYLTGLRKTGPRAVTVYGSLTRLIAVEGDTLPAGFERSGAVNPPPGPDAISGQKLWTFIRGLSWSRTALSWSDFRHASTGKNLFSISIESPQKARRKDVAVARWSRRNTTRKPSAFCCFQARQDCRPNARSGTILTRVGIVESAAADRGDCWPARAKKRRPMFGAIEALPAAGPASAVAVCLLLATASCGPACRSIPACL